jgi:DDE_Tnp_1-associated
VPVSHARDTAMTSTDESAGRNVPALLEVLAQVPDPRKSRGRRYLLTFVLAVAVACALAGARNFREAGDHAADLPQGVLARLGGIPHPLRRRIIAPSETRIRTLIQAIGADLLDELTGRWLRALADAGRLDEALTAIAIDGKWLRGVLDGQVKLFAAMLHDQKVIIGQVRVPDGTTEVTQVKELLSDVDLENVVVTADAAHSCRETAQCIAGKEEDGGREADYFLFVGQPALAAAGSLRRHPGTRPGRPGPLRAGPFPWPGCPPLRLGRRCRRGRLPARQPGRPDPPRPLRRRRPADQQGNRPRRHQPRGGARPPGGPRGDGPGPVGHRVRALGPFSAYDEDANTGYAGNGPQVMATLRNLAISLPCLSGVTEITRTLQAIARDRNRILDYLPL